jgi:hypothetical protein
MGVPGSRQKGPERTGKRPLRVPKMSLSGEGPVMQLRKSGNTAAGATGSCRLPTIGQTDEPIIGGQEVKVKQILARFVNNFGQGRRVLGGVPVLATGGGLSRGLRWKERARPSAYPMARQ